MAAQVFVLPDTWILSSIQTPGLEVTSISYGEGMKQTVVWLWLNKTRYVSNALAIVRYAYSALDMFFTLDERTPQCLERKLRAHICFLATNLPFNQRMPFGRSDLPDYVAGTLPTSRKRPRGNFSHMLSYLTSRSRSLITRKIHLAFTSIDLAAVLIIDWL